MLLIILLLNLAHADVVKSVGACKPACESYKAFKNSILPKACGMKPLTEEGKNTPVKNNGVTYDNYAKCVSAISAQWADLGQRCDSIEIMEQAATGGLAASTINTGAAVACTTACVAMVSGNVAYLPIAEAACITTSLAGMAAEIASTVKIHETASKNAKPWNDWLMSHDAALGMAVAGSVGAAAGNAAGLAIGKQAFKDTKAIRDAERAMSKAAGYSAMWEAAFAKKTAQDSAVKGAARSNAVAGLSCVSAGLLAITASVEWANYSKNLESAKTECDNVARLQGIGNAEIIIEDETSIDRKNQLFNGGGGTFGKGKGGSPLANSTQLKINDDSSTFPSGAVGPQASSATGLLNQLGGKDKIPSVLKQLGTSLSDIAKRLETSSPGSVIASVTPNMDNAMADLLKDQDKLVASGLVSINGVSSTPIGGGNVAQSSTSFGLKPITFVKLSDEQKAPEMAFAKAEVIRSQDGDIFHEGTTLTLFEIGSEAIKQNRSRVHDLPWATRMNQAMTRE